MEIGWDDLNHPDDKGNYFKVYLDGLAQRTSFKSEFRILNDKGKYKWLLANGSPRFRPDNSFAGYISSCVDITEQKTLEQPKDEYS